MLQLEKHDNQPVFCRYIKPLVTHQYLDAGFYHLKISITYSQDYAKIEFVQRTRLTVNLVMSCMKRVDFLNYQKYIRNDH